MPYQADHCEKKQRFRCISVKLDHLFGQSDAFFHVGENNRLIHHRLNILIAEPGAYAAACCD